MIKTKFRGHLAVIVVACALFTGAAAAAETITIGWTGPLSGGAALFGSNQVRGLEMAAAEINDSGGLDVAGENYLIEVVALDDKYSAPESGINGKRLVQDHGAAIVFSGHTGSTFAPQAFNERMGFLISSFTSVPQVTENGNTLTFRMPSLFTGYIAPFVQTAIPRWGKRIAMAQTTEVYGKMWGAAFQPAWEAAGGKVVVNNPMDYSRTTDFSSDVSKIVAAEPDVIFLGGPSEPTALIVRLAREYGFKGGFVLMDQAKMEEMLQVVDPKLLSESVGVLPLVYAPNPDAHSFVERYRERYRRDPAYEASLNYVGLHMVAEAMKHAGTVSDARAIRAHLNSALQTLPGRYNVHEYQRLDDKGGMIAPTPAALYADGEFTLLNEAEILAAD